jgi:hypothetical protein
VKWYSTARLKQCRLAFGMFGRQSEQTLSWIPLLGGRAGWPAGTQLRFAFSSSAARRLNSLLVYKRIFWRPNPTNTKVRSHNRSQKAPHQVSTKCPSVKPTGREQICDLESGGASNQRGQGRTGAPHAMQGAGAPLAIQSRGCMHCGLQMRSLTGGCSAFVQRGGT